MSDQSQGPKEVRSGKPSENDRRRVAVTIVYSVPEDFYPAFLALFKGTMAPWMDINSGHRAMQTHEGSMILQDKYTGKECQVPMNHIVEIGKLQ